MSWGRTALQQVVPPVLPNPSRARSHHPAAGGCPESQPRGRRAAALFTHWSCASQAADECQGETDARPLSPSLVGMLLAGKELMFGSRELCRLPTESPTAGTPCQLPQRLGWKGASLERVHAANCRANRRSRHESLEEEALFSSVICVRVQFKLILQQLPALQPDY